MFVFLILDYYVLNELISRTKSKFNRVNFQFQCVSSSSWHRIAFEIDIMDLLTTYMKLPHCKFCIGDLYPKCFFRKLSKSSSPERHIGRPTIFQKFLTVRDVCSFWVGNSNKPTKNQHISSKNQSNGIILTLRGILYHILIQTLSALFYIIFQSNFIDCTDD